MGMLIPTRRQMQEEEVAERRVAEIGISYRLWKIRRWRRDLSINHSGIEGDKKQMIFHYVQIFDPASGPL